MDGSVEKKLSVAIITPTTGGACLLTAIESVGVQDYPNLTHYIIVDGQSYEGDVKRVLKKSSCTNCKIVVLPQNTGGKGFNGHRIYAAFSYLLNEDVIMYLDEDNSFTDNHVSSLVTLLNEKNLDWAYSLRKICDYKGNYLLDDNCESLGRWPSYSKRSEYLVDTNCYAIRTKLLTEVGHFWYFPSGADRVLYHSLKMTTDNFDTTSLYTVNYCLHKDRFPGADFYKKGNDLMEKKYGLPFPWQNSMITKQKNGYLGKWSIEPHVIRVFRERLAPGTQILEFGSGKGTSELLKYFKVASIEHNPDFLAIRGDNHHCYFAQLENGWYKPEVVVACMKAHAPIAILVDGPPQKDRLNLLNHLHLFTDFTGDIIFDDIDRPDDLSLCQSFCEKLNYEIEIFHGDEKEFAWCKRRTQL
jgi:glycosyltransferase involved in cell wall biosynthesis